MIPHFLGHNNEHLLHKHKLKQTTTVTKQRTFKIAYIFHVFQRILPMLANYQTRGLHVNLVRMEQILKGLGTWPEDTKTLQVTFIQLSTHSIHTIHTKYTCANYTITVAVTNLASAKQFLKQEPTRCTTHWRFPKIITLKVLS